MYLLVFIMDGSLNTEDGQQSDVNENTIRPSFSKQMKNNNTPPFYWVILNQYIMILSETLYYRCHLLYLYIAKLGL